MDNRRINLLFLSLFILVSCGTGADEQGELSPEGIQIGDTEADILESTGSPADTKTVMGPARGEEVIIYDYRTFALLMSENKVIAIVTYNPNAETERGIGLNVSRKEVVKAYDEFNIYSNEAGAFYVEMNNDKWLVIGKDEFIYYGDPLLLTLAGGSFEQVEDELVLIHGEKKED